MLGYNIIISNSQPTTQTYDRITASQRLKSEQPEQQPVKPFRLLSSIEAEHVGEHDPNSASPRKFVKTFSSRKMSGNLVRRTGSYFSKKKVRPRTLKQGQKQDEIVDQFVRKFGKELEGGNLNLSLNKRGKCYFYIGRFLVHIEVSQSGGDDCLVFSTSVLWTSPSSLDEKFVETIRSQLKLDESMWIAIGGLTNVTLFYEKPIPSLYAQFKNDVSDFVGAAEYVKEHMKSFSKQQDEYANQPMTYIWDPTMEVDLMSN